MNFLRTKLGLVIAILTIFLSYGTVLATPLPVLDYSGDYLYDLTTGILSSDGVTVDKVTYVNGTSTKVDTATESIIGASVNITTGTFIGYDSAGDAFFNNGTFSISDSSGTYLSGDLVGIEVIPFGVPGTINPSFTGNLTNVVLGSGLNSMFIDQLLPSINYYRDIAATRITLDIYSGNDSFALGDSSGNLQGKLAPVPEPSTLLLLGCGLCGFGVWIRRRN